LHSQDNRDFDELVKNLKFLTEWFSQPKPWCDASVEIVKLIPSLLKLLSDDSSKDKLFQREITGLLAIISARTNKDIQTLVDSKAISVLADIFRFNAGDIQENVIFLKQ